jgi:hypothetical protein
VNLSRSGFFGDDLVQALSAGSTGTVVDFDRNVFGDWPADFNLLWNIAHDPEPWSLDRVLAELQTARRSLDFALTDTTAARDGTVRASSAAAFEAANAAAMAVDQMLNEEMPKANALIDVNVRWIELALAEAGDSLSTSSTEVAQQLAASLRELWTASVMAGAGMGDALSDLKNALDAAKAQMTAESTFAVLAASKVKESRVAQGQAVAQRLAAQNSDASRAADWERNAKKAVEQIEELAEQIADEKNKVLNWIQDGLSAIGFIPGVGIIADLLNAGVSVLRGNYADAAISLISAIPLAGDAVGGALKAGSKLFREMQLAKAELKLLAQSKQLCMMGRAALKFGSGGAYIAKRLSLTCFTAGTQVVVGVNPDGTLVTKNIEDLRDGDMVLAKSDQDEGDSVESKRVVSAFGKTTYHLRYLMIRDADGEEHVIQTTDEHPFWVEGIGWTNAGDLQVGQTLSELDGTNDVTLVATHRDETPEGVAVFNLTVEGDHTYFVADENGNAVWVHNKKCIPNPFGRTGDLVTQRTASAVEKMLKMAGFKQITREVQFFKAKGALKTRFVDVVGTHPLTGQRALVQIGKLSKRIKGLPIAREGEALRDIARSPSFRASDILIFVEKGSIR